MAIEELRSWVDRYEAFSTGLANDDPGPLPVATIRAALAEHDQCADDLKSLRESVRAAWPLLEPTWNALVAWVVPLWRKLEPLLEPGTEAAEAPQ